MISPILERVQFNSNDDRFEMFNLIAKVFFETPNKMNAMFETSENLYFFLGIITAIIWVILMREKATIFK